MRVSEYGLCIRSYNIVDGAISDLKYDRDFKKIKYEGGYLGIYLHGFCIITVAPEGLMQRVAFYVPTDIIGHTVIVNLRDALDVRQELFQRAISYMSELSASKKSIGSLCINSIKRTLHELAAS